jgi:hypothetical protein
VVWAVAAARGGSAAAPVSTVRAVSLVFAMSGVFGVSAVLLFGHAVIIRSLAWAAPRTVARSVRSGEMADLRRRTIRSDGR